MIRHDEISLLEFSCMSNSQENVSEIFDLKFEDWGLIEYQQALDRQLELVQKVADTNLPGYLIFCTHPEVVTMGRATKVGDVTDFRGPVIEVSRGGRATYHGPSQLVIYPIVNLNFARKGRAVHEVVGLIRDLENSIVTILNQLGIQATGKSLQKKLNEEFNEEETGVWIGNQKVASIGMAVRRWVTFHGAAINLDHDVAAFKGLKPCGFATETMISVEQILNKKMDRENFKDLIRKKLIEVL